MAQGVRGTRDFYPEEMEEHADLIKQLQEAAAAAWRARAPAAWPALAQRHTAAQQTHAGG